MMNKILSVIAVLLLITLVSFGQKIDNLKLNDQEIPEGYTSVDELQCKSIQATLLYKNPAMYSFILGDLKTKSFQSFENKDETGSVLYFEFEKDIKAAKGFLSGLLWGKPDKPTESHPEEFKIKNNILVVWSFDKKSAIKDVSRDKVLKNLD